MQKTIAFDHVGHVHLSCVWFFRMVRGGNLLDLFLLQLEDDLEQIFHRKNNLSQRQKKECHKAGKNCHREVQRWFSLSNNFKTYLLRQVFVSVFVNAAGNFVNK